MTYYPINPKMFYKSYGRHRIGDKVRRVFRPMEANLMMRKLATAIGTVKRPIKGRSHK